MTRSMLAATICRCPLALPTEIPAVLASIVRLGSTLFNHSAAIAFNADLNAVTNPQPHSNNPFPLFAKSHVEGNL